VNLASASLIFGGVAGWIDKLLRDFDDDSYQVREAATAAM
jgi:hypothetical protein